MNPTKVKRCSDGWLRIWEHNGCTCYVFQQEDTNDYIGTIKHADGEYSTVYPNDDLDKIIKDVEYWAEYGSDLNGRF